MIDKTPSDNKESENPQPAEDPWTAPISVSGDSAGNVGRRKKSKNTIDMDSPDWERDLVHRLAFSAIKEQRRARRWSIFFKFLFFAYITLIFILYRSDSTTEMPIGGKDHTAIIEINGAISSNAFANADTIISGMRAAFKDSHTKGVILRINSPGGSPVQAGYINDEIFRLREKYPAIPIYAVVTDLCASAAYYIAVATDKIYADKASIVGSVGVLMNGYGFVDTMKRLGVERRLMTAGENKAFLDPFSPTKESDKAHMQALLDNVHEQFINVVKKGRGDRLADDPRLFSGLVWTGEHSLELGLVDGLGSSSYVARELLKAEKIVDFTPRPNYLDRFAESIGVSMANAFSSLFLTPTQLK